MKNRIVVAIALGTIILIALFVQVSRLDMFTKNAGNIYAEALNQHWPLTDAANSEILNHMKQDKYLILYLSSDIDSIMLAGNIAQTLKYMKKDYLQLDARMDGGSYQSYQAVIVAFEDLANCSRMNQLVNFVAQGGRVFFARKPVKNNALLGIQSQLGIEELGNAAIDDGIKIKSNVLIKGKGCLITDNFMFNSFLNVTLRKDCQVHATTVNGTPMLWEAPFGAGSFFVFNGTMLDTKINRGMIAGIISLMKEDFIYPVYNIKVCFIDDFPSPIPDQYIPNITKHYGRSFSGFYREIWWPQILRTAKLYDIKYSGVVIETYEARVKPPLDDIFAPGVNTLNLYGRELLRNKGEIGVHGYNHQPLALKGYVKEEVDYRPWPSKKNMILGLKEVNRYIKDVYPNYKLTAYVPPSNILSPEGREALKQVMPDLKVIASLYGFNSYFTGDAYMQEFGVADDGIVELPRITYGYENSQTNRWLAINGINSVGIFSHFIHPDDVADSYRNGGKTWEQLSREYEGFHKMIYERYPWLENMTVSEAGAAVRRFTDCKVYLEYAPNGIRVFCNDFSKEMSFILRTRKEIAIPKGCTALKIDDGVYLIRSRKPMFTISLGRTL